VSEQLPKRIVEIIKSLNEQLGREATEDEIVDFVFGDEAMKEIIWSGQYDPDKHNKERNR
jgi:hypothetical protein